MGEMKRVVPIIDLQESPFSHVKLREACEEWGCFRVSNHNVPTSLMSEMKSVSRYVLDLPLEIKKRIVTCPDPFGKGYIGVGAYESLGLSPPSMHSFYSHLGLSSHHKATIEAYNGAIQELIDDLVHKIATSLGVSSSKKDLFKDWFCHVRMTKYNYTAESIGSDGIGSHTDPGFLTVLQDDEVVGGLEVAHKYSSSPESCSYLTVVPSPGSLFIFIGDMAVAWSNGKLTSAKHRVKCYEASVRVSIVSFFEGPLYDAVEAPEELISISGSSRLYKPIYFKEYSDHRTANKGGYAHGEALSLYRLQS